jgi:tetratricopeptide (TPR) repeat protein
MVCRLGHSKMTIRSSAIGVVIAIACAACSPRQARPGQPAERPEAKLLRADGLVERGCYLCLGDALALYRELIGAGFRPALVRDRVFRAATLMGVRQREVGILPAGELPGVVSPGHETIAQAGGGVPYAEVAAAIPWSVSGVMSGLPDVDREVTSGRLPAWRAQLGPLADDGDPFAAYLLVALKCSYAWSSSRAPDLSRYTAAHPASLGLAFRVGMCRPVDEQALQEVVRREPRFVEADFVLGQLCARRGDAGQAEQHYRRVIEGLPRLIAAPIALGDLLADAEEFEAALDLYERALDLAPEHRQALLGRIRSLSNLERHREALGVCDTVIRLGAWYLGPAYYWRAWNLYALNDVQGAWPAIQTAKQYLQTADVFELSGVIAFDRGDFTEARLELAEALRRNNSMCRPRFYLGRVRMDAREWIGAAGWFAQGATCYADGAAATAQKMEEVRRSATLPDLRRARLLDRYQKEMTAGEHAAALSAYHAAVNYANAGMADWAIAQAERALRDDQLKTPAAELLAKLRK